MNKHPFDCGLIQEKLLVLFYIPSVIVTRNYTDLCRAFSLQQKNKQQRLQQSWNFYTIGTSNFYPINY